MLYVRLREHKKNIQRESLTNLFLKLPLNLRLLLLTFNLLIILKATNKINMLITHQINPNE